MELVGVIGSTAVNLFTSTSDTPTFAPDIANAVANEFRFVESPKTVAAFDATAGITFLLGCHDGAAIDKLIFYNDGIIVEARTPTDKIDGFIAALDALVKERFGVTITPTKPVSVAYTSKLEVKSTGSILSAFSALDDTVKTFTSLLGAYGVDNPDCGLSGFTIQGDPLKAGTAVKPGRFVFERRAGRPLDQGIFYSEAPLSTADHMKLLEGLERSF
jgi:hypothetical protein